MVNFCTGPVRRTLGKYYIMNDFIILLENRLAETKFEFAPTQNKLSIPLVYRIYKKMQAEIKFDAIKVVDGLVINGHHRYIASILAGVDIEKFPSTKNLTQTNFQWSEVTLSLSEYDTESDIDYHNFNDAQRNGISKKEIEKILEV